MQNYKYLGTIIDQRLDYKKQVAYLKSKMAQKLFILKMIRWTIGQKLLLLSIRVTFCPT